MNKRDLGFYFFGMFATLAGVIAWLWNDPESPQNIMRRLKKLGPIYRTPWKFSEPLIKNLDPDNPPTNGTKIWPPSHPGGRTTTEYDWAFQELISKQGLTPSKAWKPFVEKFPEMDCDDPLLSKNAKESFIQAMKYRKGKYKGGRKL